MGPNPVEASWIFSDFLSLLLKEAFTTTVALIPLKCFLIKFVRFLKCAYVWLFCYYVENPNERKSAKQTTNNIKMKSAKLTEHFYWYRWKIRVRGPQPQSLGTCSQAKGSSEHCEADRLWGETTCLQINGGLDFLSLLNIETNKSEVDKSVVMAWVGSLAQSQTSLFLEYPFPQKSVVLFLKKHGKSSHAWHGFFWLVKTVPLNNWDLGPIPRKSRNFRSVSQERIAFESSNFTVSLLFVTLKTC